MRNIQGTNRRLSPHNKTDTDNVGYTKILDPQNSHILHSALK